MSRTVRKHIDGLLQQARARVVRDITALGDDPWPSGCLTFMGYSDEWRVRVGEYRVRYRIDDTANLVELVDVRHRKDIYRP
ncbi:MAG: type II toxin-antitoxin system RelE family toxin [Ktedonobacterales bacterium]